MLRLVTGGNNVQIGGDIVQSCGDNIQTCGDNVQFGGDNAPRCENNMRRYVPAHVRGHCTLSPQPHG